MTDVLDIAVLSVSERSTATVLAKDMCDLAERTGLHMVLETELHLLPRQKASVCVVPHLSDHNEMKVSLLETFPDRVNIRPMETSPDAGWSPKCPWIFKR